MILTLKVTSAAMNYQDGLIKEEELRDSQKRNRIVKLPSVLAYLGYCLNCGTHLAGPVYEISDYMDWTQDEGVRRYFDVFCAFTINSEKCQSVAMKTIRLLDS